MNSPSIPEFLRKPASPPPGEPLSYSAFTYPTHPTFGQNTDVIHILQVKKEELKTSNCIQWLHLVEYGAPCEGEEKILREAYFALCRNAFIATLSDFTKALTALAAEAKLDGVFLIVLREQEEGDKTFERGLGCFGFEGAFTHGQYDRQYKRLAVGPHEYLCMTLEESVFSFR